MGVDMLKGQFLTRAASTARLPSPFLHSHRSYILEIPHFIFEFLILGIFRPVYHQVLVGTSVSCKGYMAIRVVHLGLRTGCVPMFLRFRVHLNWFGAIMIQIVTVYIPRTDILGTQW